MLKAISLIVVAENQCMLLEDLANNLKKQDNSALEIIVVDVNSSDATQEVLRTIALNILPIRIVRHPKSDFMGGVIAGLSRARGELVMLIPPTARFTAPDDLRKMTAPFVTYPIETCAVIPSGIDMANVAPFFYLVWKKVFETYSGGVAVEKITSVAKLNVVQADVVMSYSGTLPVLAPPTPPRIPVYATDRITYDVTIIILTHNVLELTQKCLQSVEKYTRYPYYKVLVVDNASTDGTLEWLAENNYEFLALNTNMGFAPAVNKALDLIPKGHVVLLNNDTIVTSGWLEKLLDVLKKYPEVVLVGPKGNNIWSPQRITVASKDPEEINKQMEISYPGKVTFVNFLTGYCLLIRDITFKEIGKFDERLKFRGEDNDYAFRVLKQGYKIALREDCFVWHYGAATRTKFPPPDCSEVKILKEKYGKLLP